MDTNVVVAGISGFRDQYIAGRIPSADLLHRWADEEHFVWLYSEDILAEYKEVLKRLHVRSAAIGALINFIRERGESVEIRSSAEISPDPKDDAFCICAEEGSADCRSCELVQWSDRASCRRCGMALPEPIVRIVERVVEKIVIRQDPQCLQKLEQASRLISTATERLTQQCVESVAPLVLAQVPEMGVFPTMAEVERAMIVAAYEKSNRKPLEAARLLGIGKTTVYRKLRAMGEAAA